MATIDATTLTPDQLAPMLRAWAAGLYPSEAALDLLVTHRFWLTRRDFLTRLVDAVDDGWGPRGAVVAMASVDWDGVAAFLDDPAVPASSSEVAILRLAASLAGTRIDASLMELTGCPDPTNAGRVLDALAHRLGWHEHGLTRRVTGHQLSSADRATAQAI